MIGIRIAALAACLVLGGCVTRGALIAPSLTPEARPGFELTHTPFYPQSRYQCGPAALATVLAAADAPTTPEELTPLVYLPARRGSLQVEMEAAPRQYGRLSYVLDRNLDAILAEVDAGRPVLVLHNYGLPFLPRWHYAVVVGYDSQSDEMVLRSGVTEREILSARHFMRAWDNGGRWAMVVLQPGELPARAGPSRYLESAAAFEQVAPPQAAWLAFDTAARRWPDEPVAWIGRGTAAYRRGDLRSAAHDFRSALQIDPAHAGARNNLAMTWLELGCPRQAQATIGGVDPDAIAAPIRAAIEDTRAQVNAKLRDAQAPEPDICTSTPEQPTR